MKSARNILLVSKFSQDPAFYTYASSFERTLKKMGYHVEIFNCKKIFLPLFVSDYESLNHYLKKINNLLIQEALKRKAHALQPDLIFFIKADNITYHTLRSLKQKTKSTVINFYPDNPFVFWNGNSNQHVLLSLPLYDYFLIWSKMLIPVLHAAGSKRPVYFPFAYDEELFEQSIFLSADDYEKYGTEVLFIGTWDQEREDWLTQLCLALPTLDLALWGNLWHENLSKNSRLRKYWKGNAMYGTDMIKAFRCSKIVLNFIRQQNNSAHNMRTFEVLASKAFLLTQRTIEQTTLPFQEGDNIECFATLDELIKKIEFYLKNDNMRIMRIQKGWEVAQAFKLTNQLTSFFERISF